MRRSVLAPLTVVIAAILVIAATPTKAPANASTGFGFQNEDVVVRNTTSDVALSGTLTIPEDHGLFPAAVLLSVALPDDRDMTHPSGPKLLRTLAEHLARNGIGTLRCDDRGVGGSTGSYFETPISDLAADALAGVELLRQRTGVDPQKVGVIGISEGAVVGAIAASRSDDIAFVVMLAGVGVSAEAVFRQRTLDHARKSSYPPERVEQQLAAMDSLFAIVRNAGAGSEDGSANQLRQLLQDDPGGLFDEGHAMLPEGTETRVELLLSPWYRSLFSFDPAQILEQVGVPVLAVTGDLDRLSPADQNFPEMLAALEKGGNRDYTLTRVPGLNHIFQEAKEGGLEEYMTLAGDFSPMGAEIVSSWIRLRFGR